MQILNKTLDSHGARWGLVRLPTWDPGVGGGEPGIRPSPKTLLQYQILLEDIKTRIPTLTKYTQKNLYIWSLNMHLSICRQYFSENCRSKWRLSWHSINQCSAMQVALVADRKSYQLKVSEKNLLLTIFKCLYQMFLLDFCEVHIRAGRMSRLKVDL